MANQDLKESVLLNLRSVTQSIKGGVPFERLQRDYRDLLGAPIPFRDLGYNSLDSFIRDIPHVISLRKNHDGQLMAEGVADESTAHIVSLVSRQKSESKKRSFRKPPPHSGMRRPLSSRYTFREGPRSGHSRYSSSPQHHPAAAANARPITNVKPVVNAKPVVNVKPAVNTNSKPYRPPGPVQNSKPRASADPAPGRKYEVAPRFLKLQSQMKTSSSQELLLSPTHSSSSLVPSFADGVNETIPPPKYVHALPNKPQHLGQCDALESARSGKEFIEIYSKMKNIPADYRTVQMGQKSKNKGYVSTLILGSKKYQSYPELKPTASLAEEEVAQKAMTSIKESKEHLTMIPETPYSNADEIRNLLSRVEEIVCEKPSGMFVSGILREYEDKFNEKLPTCLLELLKQSCYVEIEELAVQNGRIPEGAEFIVRPIRESGNQTPSSTSSKTEYAYEDLDTNNLKKTLVNISIPNIPDFIIPKGNVWDVFITNVSGWFSARLLDYSDEFLSLSKEMRQFYKTRSFPVVDVFQYQLYAACVDDNPDIWHRVIAEEIKEDDQIACYFVDEGDFTYVRRENLQEMSPCFLNLPFQAIQIALDGLEEYDNCIKYELLEKHLLGQTLIAEVKRWYTIPDFFPEISGIHRTVYSVILYDTSDTSGEDLNLNEALRVSVTESFSLKLPKLLTTSCAYLSHVTDDGLVYLRMTNPLECWIEQELVKHTPVFEDLSLTNLDAPVTGMCVAMFEDSTWHRATIQENQNFNESELISVFFVDYGCTIEVCKSDIYELEPINELLASLPPQAKCCELLNALPSPDSKWTDAATLKLLELAPRNQELIIRVIVEETEKSLAKVNLYKRNMESDIISINDSIACNPFLFNPESMSLPLKTPFGLPLLRRKTSLINCLSNAIPDVAVPAEEQMAKRLVSSISVEKIEWLNTPDNIKSPEAFEVQMPVSLSPPVIPDKGQFFDVFVTMAANPHNFFVQPFNSCPELDKLMTDMQSFYSMEENLLEVDFSMLRKNDYYAALYSDNSWYRVRIKEIFMSNPTQVAAHFVDFGDYNPLNISKLQPLYQKFKHLPCQAVKASLAGIRPYMSDWDAIHCVEFQKMVKEKTFVSIVNEKHITVEDDIPDVKVELTLIDTADSARDVYIHELLVEKEIAKPL